MSGRQWGAGYNACVVCAADSRPYFANGLCVACHSRVHNNIRRRAQERRLTAITRTADRALIVTNREGAIAYLITPLDRQADPQQAVAAFGHVIKLDAGERLTLTAIDSLPRLSRRRSTKAPALQAATPTVRPVLPPEILAFWRKHQPRPDAPVAEWKRWINFLHAALDLEHDEEGAP